jgi:hypothetical protein
VGLLNAYTPRSGYMRGLPQAGESTVASCSRSAHAPVTCPELQPKEVIL